MTTQSILTVGIGEQFATIGAAIAAANQMGGNADIRVDAGVYVNDGGALSNGVGNVTIEGVGGLARIVDPSFLAGGGGAIVTSGSNITLRNLDISDVTSPDATGAGVLALRGDLVLDRVHLHNDQNGIMLTDTVFSSLTILNSEIDHNGTGDGQTGNIRIGDNDQLTLSNSYVHDSYGGSEIESGYSAITIANSRIYDNFSTASSAIDLPKGGSLTLNGTAIERGANSSGTAIIHMGVPGTYGFDSVALNNNVIVNDKPSGTGTLVSAPASAHIYGLYNSVWNVGDPGFAPSNVIVQNAAVRPTLDTSSEFVPLQPTIVSVTGIPYTGVRLAGTSKVGSTVTVSDTVGGKTTVLGTTTASATGAWTFTNPSGLGRIDLSTIHQYGVVAQDSAGNSGHMAGALFLTDTGADRIAGVSGVQDVFAIMSFQGRDIIDNFQAATQVGTVHDVINFSGRGLTSFTQVQSIMSGSTDTIFTLAGGKTVTLTGIAPTALTAADFRFS